jgi:putative ubiquitin-RnfH superfamily antitoxin RatB of RatAB toxin-antitoxin module
MAEPIHVEVIYAAPDHQELRRLAVPAGTTVMQAIVASQIALALPEEAIAADRLGIFSRRAAPDDVLADGDRVEIYRPLTLDPKEARRRRASRER